MEESQRRFICSVVMLSSSEQIFSAMGQIKKCFRISMLQEKFTNNSFLCIEKVYLESRCIDTDKIVGTFAEKNRLITIQ